MHCDGKVKHFTKEAAEIARESQVKAMRKKHHGDDWKLLRAYHCTECGFWHVGRAWKSRIARIKHETITVERNKPAPMKIPSEGELRRRVRNLNKRHDSERRHQAYLWGKIVAEDRAWLEQESERIRIAADRAQDMADTLAIAARLYGH